MIDTVVLRLLTTTSERKPLAKELLVALQNGEAEPLEDFTGQLSAKEAASIFAIRMDTAKKSGLSIDGIEEAVERLRMYGEVEVKLFHFKLPEKFFTLFSDVQVTTFVGLVSGPQTSLQTSNPVAKVVAIIPLLEAFIAGGDRSLSTANTIEVALDEAFPDDEEVQDYITLFASYRPEGGDYLYNAEQLISHCRTLLKLLKSRRA